jgi:hypothetical protein
LYGAFVWAHRALNSRKRRFPARAVSFLFEGELAGTKGIIPAEREAQDTFEVRRIFGAAHSLMVAD